MKANTTPEKVKKVLMTVIKLREMLGWLFQNVLKNG
jgi:hypothetical protein